jgi:predicted MPP superfamily phosphohydrolase
VFGGILIIAGGVLSAIALFQGMRPPVVEDYDVKLPGLSADMDGTVLVAMSDLHLGSLLGKRWLEARVAQVKSLRPDLVVLLGDIFEGHGPALSWWESMISRPDGGMARAPIRSPGRLPGGHRAPPSS